MLPRNVIPLAAARPSAPITERSDDELMLLAQGGSKEAFGVLARRHMAKLTNFCAKLTRDPRQAEEMTQEIWLAVWVNRGDYVPEGKFGVFLYTAARNRCRNFARDAARNSRHTDASDLGARIEDVPLDASGDLDMLLDRERERRVHAALSKMPEPIREALILRFSEGSSYEEMEQLLETSESTLRSRVHHGIKKMRALLKGGA